MAYYSGVASNMSGLRQALIDACVADGWDWNSSQSVLSQGAAFLHVPAATADFLGIVGRTSATSGNAPNAVGLGTFGTVSGAHPMGFPAAYEVFVFDREVYLVANTEGDRYQWVAFGVSTVDGLPGTGMWVGGSRSATTPGTITNFGIGITPNSGGAGGSTSVSPALAWTTVFNDVRKRNFWVHSDLDGQGWWLAQALNGNPVGVACAAPLVGLLPSNWNSEAVLLPIRAYKIRPQSKISLTVDLEHARYTRVDNYQPGQVIAIGPDRWKVFPWYRKNAAARNGGGGIDHTGTLGWAIRYEGP